MPVYRLPEAIVFPPRTFRTLLKESLRHETLQRFQPFSSDFFRFAMARP